MWRYFAQAALRHESVYLYGGSPETLEILQTRIAQEFAGLQVAGAFSPPFRAITPAEDAQAVQHINASGAGTVWVSRNRLDPLTTFRDVLLGSAGVPPAAGKMPAFPAWMPISATDGCDGV